MNADATEDRWVTTYHVVFCPQAERLITLPIRFLTTYASPETEIGAVSKANHLDLRVGSPTRNANLVSLYGIDIDVVEHSAARGTIVLVDLSNMTASPHTTGGSSIAEELVAHTVECIILTAKHILSGQLAIRIKSPSGEVDTDWQQFEQIINFGESPAEM